MRAGRDLPVPFPLSTSEHQFQGSTQLHRESIMRRPGQITQIEAPGEMGVLCPSARPTGLGHSAPVWVSVPVSLDSNRVLSSQGTETCL